MFTRSAVTPPKVNWFEWNMEHSEYIVMDWLWQILGAICAVATAGEPGEILFVFCPVSNARFRWFSVSQISRNLNTTTSTGEAVKTFGTELWKFYHKGSFFSKKRKNFSQNFNVLRLQAARTPQWLQIARNSLPNFFFTIGISSKSFSWPVQSVHGMYSQIFRTRWMRVDNTAHNADITQSQAANHRRLLSHV